MPVMDTKPVITTENPPQPASADKLELRATEIAKREGRAAVTAQDRQSAYDEMRQTGQVQPTDGDEASH